MNLKLSDFDFNLPDELIANEPMVPRDSSSVLFYNGETESIDVFSNLGDFLPEKTVLIFNKTKVYKARLEFVSDSKKVELFFLGENSDGTYKCMVRPGRYFKADKVFNLPGGKSAQVLSLNDDGTRNIKIAHEFDMFNYLEEFGAVPLPPYIKVEDANRFEDNYQTVYADKVGSVAAPTAGLHFTEELLSELKSSGVKFEYVDLEVGIGTFSPLKEDTVIDNELHGEFCVLDAGTAKRLNEYKEAGFSLISVGTTALRTLQSAYRDGAFVEFCDSTNIFIYPPYDSWSVDGLITNFHLPKSSLFILISAFIGTNNALRLYNLAVESQLRFYSFGDACLFLR